MWRPNVSQSGSNEAPLGGARRWGGDSGNGPPPPQGNGGGGYGDDRGRGGGGYGNERSSGGYDDRGRGGYESRGSAGGGGYESRGGPPPGTRYEDERRGPPPSSGYGAPPPPPSSASPAAETGERKRKSRWGNEKSSMAMPVAIEGGVDGKDLESYALQLRLDEISRALRTGMVVPPDGSRSPSPPPTYDGHGRRTNTREVRYRKKLEDERVRLVDRQMKSDPNFKPPTEYLMAKRQGGRPQDKVYIPVKEFPEINFFGLLVGPRGNSLKTMERESGAKISIRGKGSVKEGKGRPGGKFDDDENDELHCLVMAETEEKVQKCVKLINLVIETAASVPEGQNDHKRNQLRELAQLNGTLRDDENQVCQNCGGIGHRKYDCPEQKNWTAGIICRVCGGAGHMARDCTQRPGRPGFGAPPGAPGFPPGPGGPGQPGLDPARAQQFDSEYASLMAELGETSATAPVAGAPGGGEGQPGAPWNQGQMPAHPVDENGEKIPPWRIASNWQPPQAAFQRPPPVQQPHHAAYTGTNAGYSSFPQANMAAAQYGYAAVPQQQAYGAPQQAYGGYPGY